MAKKIDHKSRAHALLSPSSALRWLKCTASPIAELIYPDEETEAAAEGTLAHEVAQVYASAIGHGMPELDAGLRELRGSNDRAEHITQDMLDCAESYAAYIQELMTPTAILMLEQQLDFSEWVPEGRGTGDCIIIDNGVLTVMDYKYGQGVKVDAPDNPQMMLYALGAIHDYGCVYDFDRVRMVIYQPRMNNVSEAEMPTADLLTWAEKELKPKAQAAWEGKGTFAAGYHCRFCKHAGRCREFRDKMCEFVETRGLRVAVPHMTDEEYVEYFRMKKLIELWIKRVDKVIYDRLFSGEGLPGLKLVAGRSTRTWADEAAAQQKLGEEGLNFDEIMEPAKLKSPAALEKAIGKKKTNELLGELIVSKAGNPTPAEENDKRPAFDPSADFDSLD